MGATREINFDWMIEVFGSWWRLNLYKIYINFTLNGFSFTETSFFTNAIIFLYDEYWIPVWNESICGW